MPYNRLSAALLAASLAVSLFGADAPAELRITSAPTTVSESSFRLPMTITRAGTTTTAVSAVVEGIFCDAVHCGGGTAGTVSFAAGETSKVFHLGIDDDRYSGNRTCTLSLRNPSAGAVVDTAPLPPVTIIENEPKPSISISDLTVKESAGVARFTVSLTGAVWGDLVVGFSTGGGTASSGYDYQPLATTLTFDNGKTSRTVDIAIFNDAEWEPEESFGVHLTGLSTAYVNAGKVDGTGTITNDDLGSISGPGRLFVNTRGVITVRPARVANTPQVITVLSSESAIAVPATVPVPAGASEVEFSVNAVRPGSSKITAVMPLALGTAELSTTILVVADGSPAFATGSILIPVGATRHVALSMVPPQSEDVLVGLTAPNGVQVPTSVIIPAGKSVDVPITATKIGSFTVNAIAPPGFGGNGGELTVTATPVMTITGVTPSTGTTAGDTALTLTGTNFPATGCTVRFGAVAARGVVTLSPTSLRAVTPPHAVGPVDLTVTCTGFPDVVRTNGFTYFAETPTLASVAPSFGSTRGGTVVRVSGSYLLDSCGVSFGNAPAARVRQESTAALLAETPAHVAGRVAVELRCASGTAALADAFTFTEGTEPAASIVAIEPPHAAPGALVTLRGSRFRADDRITFGTRLPLLPETTTPDTQTVRVPELEPGNVSITLQDVAGRATTTGPIFTVDAAASPALTSISPSSAPAGAELRIVGSGFRPGFGFALGDRPLLITHVTPNEAIVRVPRDLPAATYELTLLRDGAVAGHGPSVTITAGGPRIAAVEPACADSEGGASIVLLGSGFAAGARVTIDDVAATTVMASSDRIEVIAPGGAVGDARIAIACPDGSSATLSHVFRYSSPFQPDTACGRARSVRH